MTEFDERLSRVLEQSIYGDLILGIIHNLSTPLSGILGGAQLLEMRMKNWTEMVQNLTAGDSDILEKIRKDHDKNVGNVELIIRNARNLSDLVSNMVQAQNKSAVEEIEVINLQEFLRQVLKFLDGDMVFKHQVKKVFRVPDSVPPLRFIYNHASQLIIEWIRRCLPALEKQESPRLDVLIEPQSQQVDLRLTLNVRLVESDPMTDLPGNLVPFLRGIRLPLKFYLDRVNSGKVQVDASSGEDRTTLHFVFPR